MNNVRLSLLVIFIIYCTILNVSALVEIIEGQKCNSIESSHCGLTFRLSSPGVNETISAFSAWNSGISVISDVGTCTLSSAGLVIKPKDATTRQVVCTFVAQNDIVIAAIQLGTLFNNAVIPPFAFSSTALEFTPISPNCSKYGNLDSCSGTLVFNSNLLPLTISTTSFIAVQQCYDQSGLEIVLTNQHDAPTGDGIVQIYTISSPKTILGPLRCIISASRHLIAPYFHVSNNSVKIYQSSAIASAGGIQTTLLPICFSPNSAMCGIIYSFSRSTPDWSDFSVNVRNFFYYTFISPSEATCDIIPLVNRPLPSDTIVNLCSFYRKPFTSAHTTYQLNPFITATSNPTIFNPVINFIYSGQYFLGNVMTLDTSDRVTLPTPITYTKPIIGPFWDVTHSCKMGTNSPVCVATFSTVYAGPEMSIRTKFVPFSGTIDYVYCPSIPNESVVFKIDTDSTISISDHGRVVSLQNPDLPLKCHVAYYLGINQEQPYTASSSIPLSVYTEKSNGMSVRYTEFLAQSNFPLFDSTGVKYNDIPLKYATKNDCVDMNSLYCTIEIFVEYNENNPFNYMRSFDVEIPGMHLAETLNAKNYIISTSGFHGSTSDAMSVEVTMTPDSTSTNKKPYFRFIINQKDIGPAFFDTLPPGVKRGEQIYSKPDDSSQPLRQTVSIRYRKAIELGSPIEQDAEPSINNLPAQGKLVLWSYNRSSIGDKSLNQPLGFSAPFQFMFFPELAVTYDPECADPSQALCRLKFIRRNPLRGLFYTSQLTWDTVIHPAFLDMDSDAMVFDGLDANNNLAKFFFVPLEEMTANLYVGKSTLFMLLPKTYGFASTFQMDLVAFDIIPEDPSRTTLPKVANVYYFFQDVFFTRGLTTEYASNCSDRRDHQCTVAWTFEGPICVNAYTPDPTMIKLNTLIQHQIPPFLIQPRLDPSNPVQMATDIQTRLGLDWTYTPGVYFKEQISTIECASTETYFYKSFALKEENPTPWNDVVGYLSGGALTQDSAIMYLDFITMNNQSQIGFRVLTLAALTIFGSTIDPYQGKFTCSVTLGKYWQPKASPTISSPPSFGFGWSVTLRELVTKIETPSIHYSPFTVEPLNDCIESWKTGKLACTLRAEIWGSDSYPFYDFTATALVDTVINSLFTLSPQVHAFSEVIPFSEQSQHLGGPKHVASFLQLVNVNVPFSHTFSFVIQPAFRRVHSLFYITFVDPGAGTSTDLFLQPSRILPPFFLALTPNISRNVVSAVGTQFQCSIPSVEIDNGGAEDSIEQVSACALEAVTQHRSAIIMPSPLNPPLLALPTTASNLKQTIFFSAPPVATGRIMMIQTNITRIYSPTKVLFQYVFNSAMSKEGMVIDSDLGTNTPIPCFQLVDFDSDWANPPILSSRYDEIVRFLDTSLLNDFGLEELQKTDTLTTIPEFKVLGWIVPPIFTAEFYQGSINNRSEYLRRNPSFKTKYIPVITDPTRSGGSQGTCAFWLNYSHAYPTTTTGVTHTITPMGDLSKMSLQGTVYSTQTKGEPMAFQFNFPTFTSKGTHNDKTTPLDGTDAAHSSSFYLNFGFVGIIALFLTFLFSF